MQNFGQLGNKLKKKEQTSEKVLTNARLVVEVFDGKGHFDMWQSEVLNALFQQGLDIAIEESKPEDVEEKNWLTINRLACGSLLEEYEFLETTLLNRKDDVSLNEVCATLYSIELRRKDKQISSSGDAKVLIVRGRSQKKATDKRWRSKSRQRLSKYECAFCHEKGHWKINCPRLKTKDNHYKGEVAAEAKVTKCDDEESDLSLATSSSRNASKIWLLDFACSHHITPHREWFSNFEENEEVVYKADETPLTTHEYKGFEVRANDEVMKIISAVLVVMKGGRHYYVTFADDFSRRAWVYKLKTKDEVLRVFIKWRKMMETQTCRKIKHLRTDNGEEYKNVLFTKFYEEEGIVWHFTVRHTPQQNGAKAVTYECHLFNRLPSIAIDGKTPFEKVYGKPATDYDSLHILGLAAYYHVNAKQLDGTPKKVEFERIIVPADREPDDNSPMVEGDYEEEEVQTKEPQQQQHQLIATSKEREVEDYHERRNAVSLKELDMGVDQPPKKEEGNWMQMCPEGFKVAGKVHEVYDMLIASQSLDEIEKLKIRLKSEFEMKDLDEAKMILGMEIVRDRKLRKLCLTQKQYLRRRWNTWKKVPYANALSSLMYAMICTRLDISHAIGMVSRSRVYGDDKDYKGGNLASRIAR
nr:retrovirus-related Pol polyprotein from transposon TNT 1-94 [Tanacetum cinerariifolium]